MDAEEYTCLPKGSICESCIYCILRVIEPLDGDAWEIYVQEDENSDIFIQASCMVLDIDLHDHVVKACNKFDDGTDGGNMFLSNKFLF